MWVRALTLGEQDTLRSMAVQMPDIGFNDIETVKIPLRIQAVRAATLAFGIINEDGSQMFALNDAQRLERKNNATSDRVFAAIMRLSGVTKRELDELVGNSNGDPSADSSTD